VVRACDHTHVHENINCCGYHHRRPQKHPQIPFFSHLFFHFNLIFEDLSTFLCPPFSSSLPPWRPQAMDLPQMDQETRRQLAWHMEDQLGVPRNQDLFDGWRDRMGWAGMGRTFCWLFNPVIIKGKGSSTILDDFPIKAAVIRDFPASHFVPFPLWLIHGIYYEIIAMGKRDWPSGK